jgi:oligopeptide transport system substrate-binding protein
VLFQLATTLYLASRYREAQEAWDRAFTLPLPTVALQEADVELRLGTWHLPWETNPSHTLFATNMLLAQQLYDGLMDPIEGPALTPGMAERWTVSDDGRVLTLMLRDGLQWNDGAPLDAWQIALSIRTTMLTGTDYADLPILLSLEGAEKWTAGNSTEEEFSGLRALDERTLQFRLTQPVPYFPFILMYPSVGPYRPDGVGTGPFEVERMNSEEVVLRRAPAYTRSRGGNVRRVTIREFTSETAQAAFERGELDISLGAPDNPASNERLVLGAPSTSVFLMHNANTTDIHLRRALAAATDRDIIREGIAVTDVIATGGLVPSGLPGHTPDIAIAFDPDAARQHLARSTSLAPGEPVRVGVAIEHRHAWREPLLACWSDVLRVPVDTESRPMAEVVNYASLGCHTSVWHWVAGYPDPDYFLRVLLHSNSTSNKSGWHDDRFDALIDQAVRAGSERGGADRMSLFHEADRLAVRDECMVIPLTYRCLASLVQPNVEGWWHWGAPVHIIDEVTIGPASA